MIAAALAPVVFAVGLFVIAAVLIVVGCVDLSRKTRPRRTHVRVPSAEGRFGDRCRSCGAFPDERCPAAPFPCGRSGP